MSNIDKMIQMARTVMKRAYAPYSKFNVGAVVRGESGQLYTGCNVENAAYPSGTCAEQSAISAMVAAGETKITEVLVMGDSKNLVSPCGACRQRIRELASDDVKIHICDINGIRKTVTLKELLPLSFGQENFK